MAMYAATAHSAAHTACATEPSTCSGRREAASVPTAAAPQPKRSAEQRGHLHAWRRVGLLGAKAVPLMSLLAPTSTHCKGILPPRACQRRKSSKESRQATRNAELVCADLRGCVVRNIPHRHASASE